MTYFDPSETTFSSRTVSFFLLHPLLLPPSFLVVCAILEMGYLQLVTPPSPLLSNSLGLPVDLLVPRLDTSIPMVSHQSGFLPVGHVPRSHGELAISFHELLSRRDDISVLNSSIFASA